MERSREDQREGTLIDRVEQRYRTLSAEADEALDRLGDLREVSRPRIADEVDHVEATRELMSSQVVALRRASGDHFGVLRQDIERVSTEFEEAVQHLRRMAEPPTGRRRRGGAAAQRRQGSDERPHPEPGDVAR